MKHTTTAGILFLAALLLGLAAAPGVVRAQIGDVDKSDKEIVASGIWILGYQKQDSASATAFTIIGEAAFRYFVADKLGVGLSGAAYYKTADNDASDNGFTVQLLGTYYQPLSDSLYIAPGLGLGVSFGTRDRPDPMMAGVINRSDILGFTTSFGLPFVLFTPGPFNIRAGPEIIATFGSAKDAAGDSQGFTTVDGGFKIGAGFNF